MTAVFLNCQVNTISTQIALVPDASHPHDPHPENPLHSQPGFMAAWTAYHAWHCHGNNHSLHLAWQTTRYAPSAAFVLPMANRHDFRVYVAGNVDGEDLCVEVVGVVVGGGRTVRTEEFHTEGTGEVSLLCRCLRYIWKLFRVYGVLCHFL